MKELEKKLVGKKRNQYISEWVVIVNCVQLMITDQSVRVCVAELPGGLRAQSHLSPLLVLRACTV